MTDMDLYRKLYRQGIYSVGHFDKPEMAGAKFMAVIDDSYSAMGADYGPPDPPPTMETHNTLQVVMLHDEAEVVAWVTNHNNQKYGAPKAFRIFKVEAVTIGTTVSVTVG